MSATTRLDRASTLGLVWTLVRTDFKTRYHGTLGGFLWALLKPLAMFVVLYSVFSFVFTSAPTYNMNLIIGLFLWDFFAEGTKVGLLSLASKHYLLTKARFRAWIIVVASMSNAVITLATFSGLVTIFLVATGRSPGGTSLGLYVYYVLAALVMIIGFSLAASVLFLRYRDLNQVWEVATQAGFFLAPIIYPLSVIPERFHFYFYLWPPTPVIQFSRAVLVEGAVPSPTAHLLLALEAVIMLGAGMLIFRHSAPRAAEYV